MKKRWEWNTCHKIKTMLMANAALECARSYREHDFPIYIVHEPRKFIQLVYGKHERIRTQH